MLRTCDKIYIPCLLQSLWRYSHRSVQNGYFLYPLLHNHPSGKLQQIFSGFLLQPSQVPGLPDSGKLFCLCTAHTCHRQTDGQTDRPIDRRKSDPNSEVFIIMKYLLKSLTLIYLFMLFIDLFLCTYLFQYFFGQCQKLYKSICICKNESNQT